MRLLLAATVCVIISCGPDLAPVHAEPASSPSIAVLPPGRTLYAGAANPECADGQCSPPHNPECLGSDCGPPTQSGPLDSGTNNPECTSGFCGCPSGGCDGGQL